jgi:hypothetical protein
LEGLSEGFDGLVEFVVSGAEVDDEDLVLALVDSFGEASAEADEFDVGEFAEEDGVLGMVAEVMEGLEDAGAAVVVGDIVADEEVSAHGGSGAGVGDVNLDD